MMTLLAKRIAVVTGASRGLGCAAAQRLARDGYAVAINYREDHAQAEQLEKTLSNAGYEALCVQGDLSSVQGVLNFYAELDKTLTTRYGVNQFDALVCNAGVIRAATIEQTTEQDFDALFDLNVKGVYFCIQNALPRIRPGGTIVTLGTGLTRFSYPQYAAYAASKGAVQVLTQVLAKHLGPRDVTVNMVAPGPIDTDMNADWLRNESAREQISAQTALGRVGMPSDVEGAIAFLCGPDSRWVTGQCLEVSGGIHL
jgi:3-oxoacyl-[acyl-carrier protein] reductase